MKTVQHTGLVRVGFGYDIHQFAEKRKLILGGVRIPHERGLLGHSDADVLLHAICDALLGAAALGDIGVHFPNSDPAFKNIASLKLLRHTSRLLAARGYSIVNIDATVVLEAPKIMKYAPEMRANMARVLKIDIDQVSVKATTNETLGHLGRGEGCAAYAIAAITQRPR